MQDFFSILPFLILLASVGFLILIGASVFLIRDLRQMRREHLEGVLSIWYQRSRVRSSLKWMGYGLLVVLLAFGSGLIQFLPRDIAIISIISMVFVVMSINIVIASSRVLRDLRSLHREHGEAFSLIWYRRPTFLKKLAWLLLLCGPLLSNAYVECALLAQDLLHQSFPETTAPIIYITAVFVLFAVVLYISAICVGIFNGRSY